MTDTPQFSVTQQPVYDPRATHGSQIVHPSAAKPLMKLLNKMPKMRKMTTRRRTTTPHRKKKRYY